LKLSQDIAFQKLRRYCNYQDRCHQEVRYKLLSLKVYGDDLEEIITELIQADLLNEERYARSYCRGKFRLKKWGRNKIKQNLMQRHISAYCIRKGMEEIDPDEYMMTLRQLYSQALHKYGELAEIVKKDKAIRYASARGYEAPLIFEVVKEVEENGHS